MWQEGKAGVRSPITANIGPSQSEFDPSHPLSSFVDVLCRLVLYPEAFFTGIPRRDGLRNSFFFTLICVVINLILNIALIGPEIGLQISQRGEGRLVLLALSYILVIMTLSPLVYLVVGAGCLQLVVRIVVGSENAGYRATFRVLAYATSVVYLVDWIPIIGLLLSLHTFYLQVVGLRGVHETTTGRAILVLVLGLVIGIILLLLVLLAVFLIIRVLLWLEGI
jgi:hypothetical protein